MISKLPLNNSTLETDQIRKIYRETDRLGMIILILALPLFGIIYLYHSSGSIQKDIPQLTGFFGGVLLAFSFTILLGQYLVFHQHIKKTFQQEDLLEKVKIYAKATKQRFLFLFLVSVASSVGLLFSGNPGYVLSFALCLVFFSLAKPSPDRMVRLLKLKKEDRAILLEAARPE